MSRRMYLLGVGIVLVGLAFAVTDWALRPPFEPGVTEANVRRIQPGMTPSDVERVLGVPPFPGLNDPPQGTHVYLPLRPLAVLLGKEGLVSVRFTAEYRVVSARYDTYPNRTNQGLLAGLRAWFGW